MAEEETRRKKAARVYEEIDGKGSAVNTYKNHVGINEEFGLCSTCDNLKIVKTEFKVLRARCDEDCMNITLTAIHPITECSEYMKKGEMSLYDMVQMATFIDAPKDLIGFK